MDIVNSLVVGLTGLLVFMVVIGGYCYATYLAMEKSTNKLGTLFWNLAFLVATIAATRYAFPRFFHDNLFKGVWIHLPYLVPLAIAAVLAICALGHSSDEEHGLAVVFGLAAILVIVLGSLGIYSYDRVRMCQIYSFAPRQALLEVDPHAVRFTPQSIAVTQMLRHIKESQYTIEDVYVDPVDVGSGLGYSAPIIPDGPWQIVFGWNPGIMVYNDQPGIPDEERVTEYRPDGGWQKVGQEMMIWDNMELKLYGLDPCADYEIYHIEIAPGEFVAMAARIKYRFVWPTSFIPYWDGVTIVHRSGKFEVLTTQQALADPRLQGKRLFPEQLARDIVAAQKFDQGIWSGWWPRPGQIKIPSLPGSHQMPFLTNGMDHKEYWVTATEPSGSGYSLFRVYYIDAHTGDRSAYQCTETLVGPDKAVDLVHGAPDLVNVPWVTHSSDGKTAPQENARTAIEPTYIQRNGRLYWKVTITTTTHVGITLTAVVDASRSTPEGVMIFRTREAFQQWLDGGLAVPPTTEVSAPSSPQQGAPPTATSSGSTVDEQLRYHVNELQRLLQPKR